MTTTCSQTVGFRPVEIAGASLDLARFNALPPSFAEAELARCCTSRRWSSAVSQRRPFGTHQALLHCSDDVWDVLPKAERLAVLNAHPRIGGSVSSDGSAGEEQGEVRRAPIVLKLAVLAASLLYEARFGFRFVICATGRSPGEILAAIASRIRNPRDAELSLACREQRQILRLRLRKLIA